MYADVTAARAQASSKAGDAEPRQTIDWRAVERDYRGGHLSLREMSRKHLCT